jgi:hypothetical protein
MKYSRRRSRLVGGHSTNHILPYTNSFIEGIMTWVRIRLKQNMTIRVVVMWLTKMVQPLISYKTSYTRLIATRVSILNSSRSKSGWIIAWQGAYTDLVHDNRKRRYYYNLNNNKLRLPKGAYSTILCSLFRSAYEQDDDDEFDWLYWLSYIHCIDSFRVDST